MTLAPQALPWAPTHGKTEPWRAVVFGGEAIRQLLDETLAFYKKKPDDFFKSAFPNKKTGEPDFKNADEFEARRARASGSPGGGEALYPEARASGSPRGG